ncbi:MAG: acetylesterase [Oscillospiraceae bacterium]|nr:acetylesterase [Oscillospiraceae bacterium]
MASGRMEFHAQTIMQHANFSFVLPDDTFMPEVRDPRHYERPPKTLILLHGLTGTDTDWLFRGAAQEMAVQYNLAVFMPTAGNSFYLDRGYPGGNYAAFIGEEFPAFVRSVFGHCRSREDTLIGGLSMGGYGALHIALAYPETFGTCIALSAALRIYETGGGAVIPDGMVRDVFGPAGPDRAPETQLLALKGEGRPIPQIYLACGRDDPLAGVNRELAAFLRREAVPCCYEEGPGAHDWKFWNEYIDRGLRRVLNADPAGADE